MKTVKQEETNKNKVLLAIGSIMGGLIFSVVTLFVISKIMPYTAAAINKQCVKALNAKKSDDDWGPVIEKKK